MNQAIQEIREHLRNAGTVRVVNGELVAVAAATTTGASRTTAQPTRPAAAASSPSPAPRTAAAPAGVTVKDHHWGSRVVPRTIVLDSTVPPPNTGRPR